MRTSVTSFLIGLLMFSGVGQAKDLWAGLNDYHVVWTEQSKDASESMPLMGGDIGCNVWVENGELLLYAQRSGSLSENGEYLKLGRFRIAMSPNLLLGDSFRQELKLADGFIEIESGTDSGQKVLVKLWVDVHSPVIHIDIEASRDIDVTASYESWRTEDTELLPISVRRDRFTCFSLEGYPGKVMRVKDQISADDRSVLFYHRNPKDKLIPEFLIKQQNLEAYADEILDDIKDRTFGGFLFGNGFVDAGTGEGTYQVTPYRSWRLKSQQARKTHHLCIATHIEQAKELEDWHTHLSETVAKAGQYQSIAFDRTVSWWHAFWKRSHIFVQPEAPDATNPVWQMGRNYQLFRYQLGGNVSGEYPTKFNGGHLIYDPVLINGKMRYDPDWRQWGGAVHTAQNQRLVYWPMLKAGDFDAILPQFELYRKGLPGATARVKKHFGHNGAVFSEYMSAPGIVFGAGWGWEGTGHRARGQEIPLGDPRATGARGYNSMVEQGVMANQSCAYHWESQVEHAYMILEYHRFTGRDIGQYMPFIKAATVFFDEHYQLRQKMRTGDPLDENGKLVIYPSTSCESYRGAKNPSDLVAGLRACVESMLRLDTQYMSPEDKAYYRDFLDRIPYIARGEQDGKKIFLPAERWAKEANQELPQFYPLFPFDRFKLGDEEIPIFKTTYELAPAFRKNKVQSWHQDGIFFARMGMTEEAADFNTRKLKDSPRRFPTFWGPGHDWVPDHNWGGSGMIGLQEMLMQTIGDQIVLFPAWPKDWDVDFKLHAPDKTTIEGVWKDGKLIKLTVSPEQRRKHVVLQLP